MQEVEVVVTMVYELGEGAAEAALKAGSGGLASLVLGARALHLRLTLHVCEHLQRCLVPARLARVALAHSNLLTPGCSSWSVHAALFRAALPHASQHLVAGALLECYVRYTRCLT